MIKSSVANQGFGSLKVWLKLQVLHSLDICAGSTQVLVSSKRAALALAKLSANASQTRQSTTPALARCRCWPYRLTEMFTALDCTLVAPVRLGAGSVTLHRQQAPHVAANAGMHECAQAYMARDARDLFNSSAARSLPITTWQEVAAAAPINRTLAPMRPYIKCCGLPEGHNMVEFDKDCVWDNFMTPNYTHPSMPFHIVGSSSSSGGGGSGQNNASAFNNHTLPLSAVRQQPRASLRGRPIP